MTLAILATGDELIHGDTLNTNGFEIAHSLSSEGIPLGLHLSCSDKETDIVECLNFLAKQHKIIIIIGGLGPTSDDRTRFALSKFVSMPLIEHPEALKHIQKFATAAKVALNQGNLQQCLFPESAIILDNPYGTADGCCYHWNNITFFLLPGPPRECLPMFQHYVIPLLQKTHRSKKQILKWRIFGLAESEIAQTLEEALEGIECQTGYRLDVPYIEFKVRCTPDLITQVRNVIDPILSPHIISSVEKKASDNLRERLLTLNEPVTIIDEVTGGRLQSIILKPGMQELVNFHNLNKTNYFFHLTGLNEYWQQKPIKGTTQLSIHYKSSDQEGNEEHKIPYRSPLVVNYATEWLSFRLVHLINKLHQ